MAASRASVSRFPRPQSTMSRVRSVSSNVMLPELPDASMDTRNPIDCLPERPYFHALPLQPLQQLCRPLRRTRGDKNQIFSIIAERFSPVNPKRA